MKARIPASAVNLAIFERLSGDPRVTDLAPVFSWVPRSEDFPYTLVGHLTGTDSRTKQSQLQGLVASVHVYTTEPGWDLCQRMMNAVTESLTEFNLALGDDFSVLDGSLSNSSWDLIAGEETEDGRILRHGVLRYDLVVIDEAT